MSFMGRLEELPKIVVQRNHKLPEPASNANSAQQRAQKELVKQAMGQNAAQKMFKDDKQAWKDRKSNRRNVCMRSGCGMHEEGQNFSRCSKCWEKAERTISYCSRWGFTLSNQLLRFKLNLQRMSSCRLEGRTQS
jgi:hypothetical protein